MALYFKALDEYSAARINAQGVTRYRGICYTAVFNAPAASIPKEFCVEYDEPALLEPSDQILTLLEAGKRPALQAYLDGLSPGDIARAMSRLDREAHHEVLTLLHSRNAADLIEELPDAQGAELLDELAPEEAARIVEQMVSDERADVLASMPPESANAIIHALRPATARDIRQLLRFPPDTAGGLMITEYLSYDEHATINEVIDDMRRNAKKYQEYSVQYIYVLGDDETLAGIVPLRGLVLRPGNIDLKSIMIRDAQFVHYDADLDSLEQLFDRHHFYGLPVLDYRHRLIGVVKASDVEEALGERAESNLMRASGIVGEELRVMPLRIRSTRRLSFLAPNIVLNMISASVIALFTDTLDKVIALAVFLPIISDMSGCSGNQAVGVSIRELSLGLIRPRDYANVFWKEMQVGLINGLSLALLIGLVALGYGYIWGGFEREYGYLLFGVVVAGALGINTLISVCLGGLIPLALKGIGWDPALASAPILTTVTDMVGFFLALLFAGIMLA